MSVTSTSASVTPLNEIWGKLRRAEEHRQAWQDRFDEWFAGDTHRFEGVPDDGTGWLDLRLVSDGPPPLIPLAVVFADYLHNVRRALDNVIWHLVTLHGGTPNTNTSFPVIREEKDWRSALGSKLRQFPTEWVDVVEGAQPFKGKGDPMKHWLYLLHQLDLRNKHKLMVRLAISEFACEPRFRFNREPEPGDACEEDPPASAPELSENVGLARVRAVSATDDLRILELLRVDQPALQVEPLIDFVAWSGPLPDFTAEVRKVVKMLAPAFGP